MCWAFFCFFLPRFFCVFAVRFVWGSGPTGGPLGPQQRGTPHWVVGTQLFVVFNLPALPNQCHRTSAATFMLQLARPGPGQAVPPRY